jgi:hypothetical protein
MEGPPLVGINAADVAARPAPARTRRRDWRRWLGFDPAPALRPPWRPLTVTPELLSLGPTLRRGAARGLLLLDNGGGAHLAFRFELGAFDGARGGAAAGRLELRPAEGVVAPGGSVVVQAVFEAGVQPQLFEAEVGLGCGL